MNRSIYLVRHGHPDFPVGAHMCLGRTDTPLGPLGRMQACLLGEALPSGLTVFASPLTRCRETAAPLSDAVQLVPELAEQDMGPWDGLDFDTIRERWPEFYTRRAEEPLLVPPGAEPLSAVQSRVVPAFMRCLDACEGDLAVVVHASVIQALLAWFRNIPLEESRPMRPPYGSYALLHSGDAISVEFRSRLPELPLTPSLAEKLLSAAAPGERIERHCRAVARYTLRFSAGLPLEFDVHLLYSAAVLHDIARSEPEHAKVGAQWLRALGYPEAAKLVECHHNGADDSINESNLLYLADKCVQEDRIVPLEERFVVSRAKCRTEDSLLAHEKRYRLALTLRDQVNALAGCESVK